ncbi:MAG: hypothetical protein ACYC4P_13955, partial [Thermoanaerobaculia bacterium]
RSLAGHPSRPLPAIARLAPPIPKLRLMTSGVVDAFEDGGKLDRAPTSVPRRWLHRRDGRLHSSGDLCALSGNER